MNKKRLHSRQGRRPDPRDIVRNFDDLQTHGCPSNQVYHHRTFPTPQLILGLNRRPTTVLLLLPNDGPWGIVMANQILLHYIAPV